jgi:hypothetical protein
MLAVEVAPLKDTNVNEVVEGADGGGGGHVVNLIVVLECLNEPDISYPFVGGR